MKEKGELEEENAPPCKEYEREIDGKCYPASPTDQGRDVGQTPFTESVNLSTIRQFILEETVGFFKNRIEKPHGRESSSEEFVRKHVNETDLEEKKNNSKKRNAYVASVMRKIKRKR